MMLSHKNKSDKIFSILSSKTTVLKYFLEIEYRHINLIKGTDYKGIFSKRLLVISEEVRPF